MRKGICEVRKPMIRAIVNFYHFAADMPTVHVNSWSVKNGKKYFTNLL